MIWLRDLMKDDMELNYKQAGWVVRWLGGVMKVGIFIIRRTTKT
jgi:hypothetical protein